MSALKTHIAKVATGSALSFEEAREAFDIIMSGDATPGQIGGFLMALRVRGETVSEISGAVATMRAKMLRVEAPEGAIDIVGTGGDNSHSVNISTASAFVIAGCGVSMATRNLECPVAFCSYSSGRRAAIAPEDSGGEVGGRGARLAARERGGGAAESHALGCADAASGGL